MKTPTISKSQFLKGVQCQKRLWYYRNRKDLKPEDDDNDAKFAMGNEVGEIAKAYFENEVEVKEEYFETEKAIDSTKKFIEQGNEIIFEATAMHPVTGAFSKIDVLRKAPNTNEWDLIEVKSAANIKSYHIDDISFQYYVFHHAGYNIRRCFLMLLNSDYIRQGDIDPKGLLRLEDITEKVVEKQNTIDVLATQLAIVPTQKNEPTIAIGSHCFTPFECDYKEHCWQHVPEYSIYNLFSKKQADGIYKTINSYNIKDIPVKLYPKNKKGEINLKNKIDIESFKTDAKHIDKEGINNFLNELEYPLHYLDYETISCAIPVFDGTSPYQAIPFQFSLHIQESPEADLSYFSYLHRELSDPRRAFTEKLISDCSNKGSVVVFNKPYEMGVNKGLAKLYPQYADKLEAINKRMIDLLIPFRKRFLYTSEQKSSCSIKNVYPAYYPNEKKDSYKDMEIADGFDASQRYLKFMRGKTDNNEPDKLWDNLYKYCKLDTMAMVKLVDKLNEFR